MTSGPILRCGSPRPRVGSAVDLRFVSIPIPVKVTARRPARTKYSSRSTHHSGRLCSHQPRSDRRGSISICGVTRYSTGICLPTRWTSNSVRGVFIGTKDMLSEEAMRPRLAFRHCRVLRHILILGRAFFLLPRMTDRKVRRIWCRTGSSTVMVVTRSDGIFLRSPLAVSRPRPQDYAPRWVRTEWFSVNRGRRIW